MWQALFNIFLVLFLVMLNGFFVAAEFAIVKVRSTQIDPLVAKGDRRAKIAKEIITHLDAYLSATQLGITMASLALGWVGEPFVAAMIRPWCEGVGITNVKAVEALSFGIAFSIITFLHIVLGELAPKSIAIQKARATTLWIAYPLTLFSSFFKPFIWSLNSLANVILRMIGIQAMSESELLHSEEELRLLLAQEQRGSIASKNIVLNAMDFRKKQARHSMVPRKDVVALPIAAPVRENIETMRAHKFSRYPVYNETIDNIIGIVNTKDIFKHDLHMKPEFTLESVLRDAIFLPETVSLEKVLETILLKKNHLVMLADEFGGTAGIITLENVLEELVGPIQDEFDRERPEIVKLGTDEYLLDAALTTNDIERLIERELSPKDILSIGAFVIEQLGHIPQQGERVEVAGVEFTVERVNDRMIDRIRVKRLPLPQNVDENENP